MGHVKVDQVRVVLPAGKTPEEMVTDGEAQVTGIQAGKNYNVAGGVQTATTAYANALAALKVNNAAKAKAKADLQTAETNEPTLVRRVGVTRRGVGNSIEIFADGSKDTANSFNVAVEDKQQKPEAITPENLRAMKSKTHDRAGCRWDPVPGAHAYILQHAANPADSSTYSAELSIAKARFWLTSQTRGSTVYFRVLACDERLPNGRTPYSAWVAVVVA
jgi:hypothetical protein